MKKIKLDGKLSLNKETIAKLNDKQMSHIVGGDTVLTNCGETCEFTTCERQTDNTCANTCAFTCDCPPDTQYLGC